VPNAVLLRLQVTSRKLAGQLRVG